MVGAAAGVPYRRRRRCSHPVHTGNTAPRCTDSLLPSDITRATVRHPGSSSVSTTAPLLVLLRYLVSAHVRLFISMAFGVRCGW